MKNNQRIEEYRRMLESGMTYCAIARHVGISRQAVTEFCRKTGLKRKPFNYTLPVVKTQLQKLKESGLNWCGRCKSTDKPLMKSSKNRLGTIQYFICHDCNNARFRRYYKTESGKEAIIRAKAKYEAKLKQNVSSVDNSIDFQTTV